jgi:CBS-domain-containing membrane protein
MTIASICTRTVVTVDAASTLTEAARRMREHHVGALVVTQTAPQGTAVVGVVTDRDLAVEVLARGAGGSSAHVGSLVRGPLVAVSEDAGLADAVAQMQQHGVRRLLVSGAQGQLVGIVSLDDLLGAYASQLASLAQVVQAGLAREVQERATVAAPPVPPLRVPAMGTAGWTQPTGL